MERPDGLAEDLDMSVGSLNKNLHSMADRYVEPQIDSDLKGDGSERLPRRMSIDPKLAVSLSATAASKTGGNDDGLRRCSDQFCVWNALDDSTGARRADRYDDSAVQRVTDI